VDRTTRSVLRAANILNYLKVNVYHNKLPISRVDTLLDAHYRVTDEETQKVIEMQLDGFLKFSLIN